MKKSSAEISLKLRQLIEEQTLGEITASSIDDEDLMRDNLGLDSLDYASVFLGAEQWLGIKVKESGINWGEINTVGRLADLLESQQ